MALLAYLALIPAPRVDGQLIGSDGVGYYLYLRSAIIDHDLDFADEYAHFRGAIADPGVTPIGRRGNLYAIGPAVLWAPAFFLAHAVALLGHSLGLEVVPDGYGYVYQAAIEIASIVYGSLGFALAYRCAARIFSPAASVASASMFWLASNAIYYMVFEPSMSHMVSLFSVSLLLSAWFFWFWRAAEPHMRHAAALGVSAGLVALVRLQDALFVILPFGHLLVRASHLCWTGRLREAQRWLAGWLLAGLLALLVFLPQLVVWQRLYGTWDTSPYARTHDPPFYWLHPQLGKVLFSTFHGLLSWHPIFLPALLGLSLLARRDRRLALALAGLLALDVYVVAAWWQWWQGDSFGSRMLLNATWIWVLGLAGVCEWAGMRQSGRALVVLGAVLLIGWNALALVQYRLGFVPMGRPLSWTQMTIGRLAVPVDLLRRFGFLQ